MRNRSLYIVIESEVEFELNCIKNEEDHVGTCIIFGSRFQLLIQKMYHCLDLSNYNSLNTILKYYSEKVHIYIELIQSCSIASYLVRSEFLFLLRKYWIIVNIIAKIIKQLNSNKDLILYMKKTCSNNSKKELINNLIHIYLPLSINYDFRLNIGSLCKSLNIRLNTCHGIQVITRYRALKHIESLFSSEFSPSVTDQNSSSNKVNYSRLPRLENEIRMLGTLEEKTCAVLNTFTSTEKGFDNDVFENININNLLKLWREYQEINCEVLLINRILKSNNLPSKNLRCEMIFLLISSITDSNLFEKIFKFLVLNTLHDYSIIHQIYIKYCSFSEANNENKKNCHIFNLKKKIKLCIWRYYILRLINENYSYNFKIQGLILIYYLLSEFVERNDLVRDFPEEFDLILIALITLARKTEQNFVRSNILKSVLERNILTKSSIYSKNSIFSFDLVKLIGNLANIHSLNEENMKAIFYQLSSNILCDKFILENFSEFEEFKKLFNNLFLKFLSLENLLIDKNLQNFLFLFGFIPTQVIISDRKYLYRDEIELNYRTDLPFEQIPGSMIYLNSTKLFNIFTILGNEIKINKVSNLGNFVLIYADFLKRLIQEFRNMEFRKDVILEKSDFYYSYAFLYKYLDYCLENYEYYLEEHVVRTLKSVPKPELSASKNATYNEI